MGRKIAVISKVGNTVHPKYGRLDKGQSLDVDEADFTAELFRKAPEIKKKKPVPKGTEKTEV